MVKDMELHGFILRVQVHSTGNDAVDFFECFAVDVELTIPLTRRQTVYGKLVNVRDGSNDFFGGGEQNSSAGPNDQSSTFTVELRLDNIRRIPFLKAFFFIWICKHNTATFTK